MHIEEIGEFGEEKAKESAGKAWRKLRGEVGRGKKKKGQQQS